MLPVLTSPCGPNCTYAITFDGPYVKCNSYTYNGTAAVPHGQLNSGYLPDWMSGWTPNDPKCWGDVYVDCPQDQVGEMCIANCYYENMFFEWYSMDTSNTNITGDQTAVIYPRSVLRLECIPSYGKYTVNITFSNGIPSADVNSTYIGSLVDLWRSSGRQLAKGGAARWLDRQGLIKAANLFAVLTSFAEPLKGQVASTFSINALDDGTFNMVDNSIVDAEAGGSVALSKTIPQNMIDSAQLILLQL